MCRNAMIFNVRLQFTLIKVNMKGYFSLHLTLWWQTYTFTNKLLCWNHRALFQGVVLINLPSAHSATV